MSNILVSPELIKNLVSVRSLTRENPVTVEFDEYGFSVKDARTRMVLHRCNILILPPFATYFGVFLSRVIRTRITRVMHVASAKCSSPV